MTREENKPNKIAEYYDTEEHLALDLLTNGHIHLGYWDEAHRDDSFAVGAGQLTQLMIEKTEVGAGQRFCDIGCGVGGPAVMLAKAKACFVDGVTISAAQRKAADERARAQGIAEKVRFHVADALHLPFAKETFEGSWFFESIFHMGHRNALREAHRVLKTGACLLITDVIDIGLLTAEEKEYAKDLCNVDYVTKAQYPELLRRCGFELVELTDITHAVIVPFASKFTAALEARKDAVFDLLKKDAERFAAFAAVGEKFQKIGYILVKARKK